MTKKHFIKLADVIREIREKGEISEDGVEALADFCGEVNPAFNRERWLEYIAGLCGPSGGRVK